MRVNPNSELSGVTGVPARTKTQEPRLGQDQLTLGNAASLNQALEATPAVRPEKVAAAKDLAQNAPYPPEVLIQKIAALFAFHFSTAPSIEPNNGSESK